MQMGQTFGSSAERASTSNHLVLSPWGGPEEEITAWIRFSQTACLAP
jgi:hypothetical protein